MKIRPVVFALLALAWSTPFTACVLPSVGDAVIRCAAGDVCPDDLRCVQGPDGGTCRPPDAPCVVEVEGVTAEAANGTICSAGICVRGACVAPVCGDGIVSGVETCDGDVDACRSDCTRCGDGVTDAGAGEVCDQGERNSDTEPGACRTTCAVPVCGDGVVDEDETCDAGGFNGADPASCRVDCTRCGDGTINAATEACDNGEGNSNDAAGACRTDCVPFSCGDGVIDPGEACDDGTVNNDSAADACRTDCIRASCGDGVKDTNERCDDGNTTSGDGCRSDCQKIEECGDGILDDGEVCDDRNDNPRDGCDRCRRMRWNAAVVARGRTLGEELALTGPLGVAVDVTGALYIADTGGHRVLRQDSNGTTAFAGTGAAGFSGDGGPAIAAELRGPTDVAVAANGDVYIADRRNDRIRRVTTDGRIDTIVGGGSPPIGDGDGLSGRSARLRRPRGVGIFNNRLLIAEEEGSRIRQTTLGGNNVTTLVGNAAVDQLLEDGPSLTVGRLVSPVDIAPVGDTAFVIAEAGRRLVRLVTPGTLSIVTIAGGGDDAPPESDAVVATSVALTAPASLVVDSNEVFFADAGLRRIFVIDVTQPTTPTLRPIVGSGRLGGLADGTDLLEVDLGRPVGLAGAKGRLFFTDDAHHVVREASSEDGVITLVGTGEPGVDNEGALATTVSLVDPIGVAPDGDGGLFVADRGARRIYRRSPEGHLRTVAGNGDNGDPTVGAQASDVPITPSSITARQGGALIVATLGTKAGAVYEVDVTGAISELASIQSVGQDVGREFLSDLPIAIDALDRVVIAGPGFVAVEAPFPGSSLPGFTVFFMDPAEHPTAVTSVSPTTALVAVPGALKLVTFDFTAATATIDILPVGKFDQVRGLLSLGGDEVLVASGSGVDQVVADTVVSLIRREDALAGDGVVISESSVVFPAGLTLDEDGSLIVADAGAGVIRRADMRGVGLVETIAGDLHPPGPGPLPQAALYSPRNLVALPDASLLVAGANGRLLQVVFESVPRVDVVYGHPFPPTGRSGPFFARFAETLGENAMIAPDPTRSRIKVFDRNTRREIDLTPPPSSWLSVADVSGGSSGFSAGIVTPGGQVIVSSREADCVQIHPVTNPPEAFFGACGVEGAFDGLVRDPGGLALSPSGAIYLADTGNNRVLRRDPVDFSVSVVIGDGSASSAGQGTPAREFPLQAPAHVAVDRFGNLFVSSTTTVRMVANVDGDADADGDDLVITIFGAGSRATFPENESRCLGGLALDDTGGRVYVADACSSFLVSLSPVEVLPGM